MEWIIEELAKNLAEFMEKRIEIYTHSLANNDINSETHYQIKEDLATESGEEFKKMCLKMFNIIDALYKNM